MLCLKRFFSGVGIRSIPLGVGVSVITSDVNGITAFSKPPGILSQPITRKNTVNCICQGVDYDENEEAYVYEDKENRRLHRLWLINRIDVGTSGVVVASHSKATAIAAKKAWKQRKVMKKYFALVCKSMGRLSGTGLRWSDRINRGWGGTNADAVAETEVKFECGSRNKMLSLLELRPITGYNHQLRKQCAIHSVPILGDRLHGDFLMNRLFLEKLRSHGEMDGIDEQNDLQRFLRSHPKIMKRMFLHAHLVEFQYTLNDTSFYFSATSPLPSEFRHTLDFF
jgi:23S rRNA-/tRNA-specific pseudouridylate synthase